MNSRCQKYLPEKQSLKYRIPLLKNDGPFPLKDITNDKHKSIARLTGEKIIESNLIYVNSMKSYDKVFQNEFWELKGKFESVDSFESYYCNLKKELNEVQQQSAKLSSQTKKFRQQLKKFGENYLKQQNTIIENIQPLIKDLSHIFRKQKTSVNQQIHQFKRQLVQISEFKKILQEMVSSACIIVQLQKFTGIEHKDFHATTN